MYPEAVSAGIDATEFWSMDFNEIMVQVGANRQREREELKKRAYMDHELAQLIAYAFNDPNKMPSVEKAYPFIKEDQPQEDRPQEEQVPDWVKMKETLMRQANQIKSNQS